MYLLFGTKSCKKILHLSPSETYSADQIYDLCMRQQNKNKFVNFYVNFDGEEISVDHENLKFACLLCSIYHHQNLEKNVQVNNF